MHASSEKPRDLWTDQEFIEAYGQKARTMSWPLSLGKLQRPGWTGRIPVYLVWCDDCHARKGDGFTVTYEAGYARRLHCGTCRTRFDQRLPSRWLRRLLPLLLPLLVLTGLLLAFVPISDLAMCVLAAVSGGFFISRKKTPEKDGSHGLGPSQEAISAQSNSTLRSTW